MPPTEHELRILQEIERNPATTQATLAAQLGVAVGSGPGGLAKPRGVRPPARLGLLRADGFF